ncbi:MAG: YceI family protein [Aquabacterium sp.]|uniref:YceI family protein n=1 Tax=Aquabacterium sp. TaxID=1872578 RepID=UPI0025C51064|nr:YceI family protein [Aquabacterium sp.]MBI3380553.1 YceI family protein [Aquabacterium sp.]
MSASFVSRRALLALTLTGAALSLPALAAEPQALVAAKSEVTFVAKQLGVPLDGRFKTFSAQTAFDPKAPQTSKIAFTVDLGSVALNPDADTELAKPEWFNIVKFPKASFQSTAIKALGAGRFEVAGKLAIKGNARDLVVPVQVTQAGGLSTATGTFALKRLDFKVGEGDWADTSVVANDVQVKFKLVLQGVPAL